MPTRERLERALINADAAGDTVAAKQLANALKSMQQGDQQQTESDEYQALSPRQRQLPPDVPIDAPGGGVTFNDPEYGVDRSPDYSLMDRLKGAGETLLTMATGATGGTAGMARGLVEGIYRRVQDGEMTPEEGMKSIEDLAIERASEWTYKPRTEAGREYTRETGEALAPLQALAPMTGELAIMSQSAKGLAPMGARAGQAAQRAQQTVAQGKKAGVPVMTSDVFPPKTFAGKTGQAITERVPFVGTGPVRAAQAGKRLDAVKSMLSEYGVPEATNVIDDVMRQLSKKRSENLTKYTGMKNAVIQRNAGRGTVPVDKTLKTIDSEIAKLKGLKSKDVQPAINILEDYKNAFKGQGLENIELLRKQIGERFSAQDLAAVKGTTDKAINNIYRAVRDDMGDFIKNTGDRRDYNMWSVANKRLSNMMGELKNSTLKSVLSKGDATPEQVRRLLFSQKPSDLRTLKRNLTPSGRNKAKVAILQEAAEKAGGIDNLTPEKFLAKLSKLDNQVGEFFSPSDKKAISGLVEVLNRTRRAAEAGVKPPTGAELTAFAAPTGVSYFFGVDPVTGLTTTAGLGALARLYESGPIRNMLIRINQAKASGGPKVNQLIDKLADMPEYKAFIAAQSAAQQEGDQ